MKFPSPAAAFAVAALSLRERGRVRVVLSG